jgi:hypothetical protein
MDLASPNSSLVDYLAQVENRKNKPTLSDGDLGWVWVYRISHAKMFWWFMNYLARALWCLQNVHISR